MNLKVIARTAAVLAFALPHAAHAQNEVPAVTVPPPPLDEEEEAQVEPAPTRPAPTNDAAPVSAAPAPAPPPIVESVETVEAPEIINPYANSYNELLPIEAEEEQGFDDWGLLGLLGLLGLFGLKRRDRIVYAERLERDRDRG